MMKLYVSPTSPYVRKCLMLLHEAEALDQVELVTVIGTPLDSSGMPVSHNPLGKIPVLERPDGPAVADSRVIMRYLSDVLKADLYPESRVYEVLTLEALADGMTDAALLMAYEWRLRREEMRFADFVEGQWSKIDRTLSMIEDRWMSHLAAPLDAAQIALACSLGYLDFRNADRGWRDGRAALAAWYDEMAARDSMVATAPPPAA